MGQTIWKYPLKAIDVQDLPLPSSARILCVQAQMGAPCLWAQLDPSHPVEGGRTIRMLGTGHRFEGCATLTYLGTVQMHQGAVVLHVFEEARA